MRRVNLRWVAMGGVMAVVAAAIAASALANPPYPGVTYRGTTAQGLPVVLNVSGGPPFTLVDESYIVFDCAGQTLVLDDRYLDLDQAPGTSINNPSGVVNRLDSFTTTPEENGTTGTGTLSWRFFMRFFTQAGGAPGGGGGQTQPPGEVGTGNFSGRHVTGLPESAGFCSFNVNFFVSIPQVSITDTFVLEGDKAFFSVTLSHANEQAGTVTSVNYRTQDGTAAEGSDYSGASGTLTWEAGDSANKTVEVSTLPDADLGEPNETFNVVLDTPTNLTIVDAAAQGTIVNNPICCN